VQSSQVEAVKKAALLMDYPLMEEYDFRYILALYHMCCTKYHLKYTSVTTSDTSRAVTSVRYMALQQMYPALQRLLLFTDRYETLCHTHDTVSHGAALIACFVIYVYFVYCACIMCRHDVANASVPMDLKPNTKIRGYQVSSAASTARNGF
jgi:hypothetical protein